MHNIVLFFSTKIVIEEMNGTFPSVSFQKDRKAMAGV